MRQGAATGERFIVSTPHHLATEAALAIQEQGGTAVDAAIAACAALTVAYPHMCAIGGDLFALVHLPTGERWSVNGSGAAPRSLDAARLAREHAVMPLTGPWTVTVPGMVAGWGALHDLGGGLEFGSLLEPAIHLAERGAPVSRSLGRALAEQEESLAADRGFQQVFFRGPRVLAEGELLQQPALAESLRALAAGGPQELYNGDVGRRLVAGLQRLGSPLSPEDLQAHTTEIAEPLRGRYGDHEVFVNPPNSQGFVLLEILGVLEAAGADLDPDGPDAGLMAMAFLLASRDRDRYLADPRGAQVKLDELLDPSRLAELASEAGRLAIKGAAAREGEPAAGKAAGDTVAVVAAERSGLCVSIVQSVFHSFGAGILEPETGIICHNRGACFSMDPRSPNMLEGGKRPAHTLMPVLVSAYGDVVAVSGTMGGRAQPQIQTHLLSRLFKGIEDPAAIVNARRWVVGGLDAGSRSDRIYIEEGVGEEVVDRLRRSGLTCERLGDMDELVGHAQLIVRTGGALAAASDPRADGSVGAA